MILDLKTEGCVEAIAKACTEAGLEASRLQICAWTERQASDVLTTLPDSRLFLLTGDPLFGSDAAFFEQLLAKGYSGLSQRFQVLERTTVARAHDQGLAVFTWTIDSPEELREALSYDVDGIISNDPGGLIAAFAETDTV